MKARDVRVPSLFTSVAMWLACTLTVGAAGGCRRDNPAPAPLPAPMPVASDALPPILDAGADAARVTGRSSGCSTPSRTPSRGETRTVRGNRTFHVWAPAALAASGAVPPVASGSRAYPLLFAFHGWGSNGHAFQKWFLMEDHVASGAIVVYPDSRGSAWDWRGDTDLAFFDAMVADLAATYCIDDARVFAIGFSYGGRMVHHLGCNRSSALRGIAVGGSDWDAKERFACGQVPVLVTHRTRDESERIAGGRASVARWAGVNGCSAADAITDAKMGCREYLGCAVPVAFCEDTHHDASWPASWNHTIREPYLDLSWRWLAALP